MDTCDDGYAEADHPGSKNGWARLSDSLPVRSAGGLPRPIIADRQCSSSICFCEGRLDCRPAACRPGEAAGPHTKDSLAREWDGKRPRDELEVEVGERNPYTGMKRARVDHIRELLTEVGRQVQRSRDLWVRAHDLRDRLRAHRAFGEGAGWDYNSDEVSGTRLIKNSSGFDLEISKFVYDTSRFRH